MKKCIFNLETTKIELHFDKSDYIALSEDKKKELKRLFLWSKMGGCWVSRCIEPHLHRAREFAKELGFPEEERQGERLLYAEKLEKQSERAEARAERYDERAVKAERRGDGLQSELNSYQGDTAFFTQPIIGGHAGSRAFANYREKLYKRYHKGFEEYRKSEYYQQRAEAARNTAEHSKLTDKTYLFNKIKECKKTIKGYEGYIVKAEETLYKIENGQEVRNYKKEIITAEAARKAIESYLEQVEIYMDRQAFFENHFESLGGFKFTKADIKKGYIINGDYVALNIGSENVTAIKNFRECTIPLYYIDSVQETKNKIVMRHNFTAGDSVTATDNNCEKKDVYNRKILEVNETDVTLDEPINGQVKFEVRQFWTRDDQPNEFYINIDRWHGAKLRKVL